MHVPGNTITPNPDMLKKYNADVYDDASAIYDTYEGLFFPYLFGRIRELIEGRFIPALPANARVLDLGCGTGQQTAIFRSAGREVVGIDISAGLVRVANGKMGENICMVSDACHLPFPDHCFDAVSCAGSTINHIPDYPRFFDEVCRVLKPGGHIFLESDNKWRPDMFWCLLSALTGDPLGYRERPGNVIKYFWRPPHEGYPYVFPLSFDENKVRMLSLRTFTYVEISEGLQRRGCHVLSTFGIHAVTNLIPSPLMLKDRPGRVTRAAFKLLSSLERSISDRWPINRAGMSLIVIAKKEGTEGTQGRSSK